VNHLDVLREVTARGLELTVSGADLRLQGPQQRVDPELVRRIREVKTELVAHLTAAREAGAEGYPMTLLQRGYLIGRGGSVEMGNVASHVYHEIDGCWDLARLEQSLATVVAGHGMLRTRFTADGRQVTEPGATVRIGRLDLRGQPEDQQQARLAELREQRSHRILPHDQAPMLAADVTLLADDWMRLHVGHDGLVLDGISMFLLFRDWWEAYVSGAEPPGGEVSFADYVASLEAMRSKAPAERSRVYWLDRLADLPPHPGLPLRTSPAAISAPRFTQHTARLAPPAWAALKARAASAGLTPTGVLLAAYAETLARWGAGPRFTLTTTVANRPPIHPAIADAIGNFSQTLLVEVDLDREADFTARAAALQVRLRRDLDHRHFSGIEVLRELARRDASADARMPFTFNSAIGYVRDDVDGSALELFGPEVYTSSQTPQVWLNAFAFEQHDGLIVQFDEVNELFPDGLIAAMTGAYQELLDQLTDGPAWSRHTFSLLPAAQRARREAANDTAAPEPAALLHEAVLAAAARDPVAPAVITTAGQVSYGELAQRVAAAAGWLRDRGVQRDELVALIMRRGPEQVTGILATLLAGGAYLPIDAGLPAERIRYMLRDGQVRCVLTNTGWTSEPATSGQGNGTTAPGAVPEAGPLPELEILALDASVPLDGPPPATPATLPGAEPDDLAYVLYTSGTTGEPKGVMVSHRNVANVVADCNTRLGIGPADRFIGVSAFNFDLSVYDVFGALSAGAALIILDADRATDPQHWAEVCGRHGVTVWNSVPAIAGLLPDIAADDASLLGSLRLVMMSGDRIPPALPAALRAIRPGLEVLSLGGPTETTIWNICHPVGADEDGRQSIPYGRPNANNRAYILDADGLDVPDWVTGEICAAGTGLARGYWRDEARTAAKFWFDAHRGERLYRTGDLGRYLPSGDIDITGRSDFQIKVNGYRIEAGEVETRLTAIGAVKQAVVVRQAVARGDRLVAHLVPAGGDRPTAGELREALTEHLPDYMTPAAVVWHDSLPLTRNGKVDRGQLAAQVPAGPDEPDGQESGPAEPTAAEQELIGLWASVLRQPAGSMGPHSSFYDLGGDSLAAARIFTGVRKQFGVGITLDRLYEVRTVRAMAAAIAAGQAAQATAGTGR
jgi:pyochelin synthetase